MDGSEVSLAAAFAAGVASFLSPCVLPLLPVYAGLLAGENGGGERGGRRLAVNTAFFLAGFTVVFIIMGASASLLGQLFLEHSAVLRKAGALIIILMGLNVAGVIRLPALARDYRFFPAGSLRSPLGAFVLGLAFTAGWTPCVGPILASVLAYAGMSGTPERGIGLLAAYSAGFGLPFMAVAVLGQRYWPRLRAAARWLPLLQAAAGVVLVLTGALLYFDLVRRGLGLLYNLWQ